MQSKVNMELSSSIKTTLADGLCRSCGQRGGLHGGPEPVLGHGFGYTAQGEPCGPMGSRQGGAQGAEHGRTRLQPHEAPPQGRHPPRRARQGPPRQPPAHPHRHPPEKHNQKSN